MAKLVAKARIAIAATAMLATASCGGSGSAPKARTEFNIGWSIYAGWMPWPYAEQAGIVKKWADKYGVKIHFTQVNDYVESVNQFNAGKLDGVTVTNMDALTIPAAGGKDTSAIILGDYSNGNDGIVLKNAKSLADIKGRTVYLVELSVSHYLLARGLSSVGLQLSDVKTVNTSDADIVGAFANPAATAVVTWNPQLTEVAKLPGATKVFDSSQVPAEILDLLAVDTATLKANPNLGKALAGIWYETMQLMQKKDAAGAAARAAMAKLAGTTPQSFDAQLSTTHLYATPQDAVAAVKSPAIGATMVKVRDFSFSKGLFGQGAKSADAIGISVPGKTIGDAGNVKLRFDPTYMELAAAGKL
nr:putative urea ABC transporter substrate-binding protein [uncultured Sphingomonas sp.]